MQVFNSLEVSIIIHATEDHNKIFSAINRLFGIDNEVFILTRLEGHHGNEILLAKARLDSEEANRVADRLFYMMERYEKKRLLDEIIDHTDKNHLYVRIGKQEVFDARIALTEEEAIRFKFRFNDIESVVRLLDG